MQKFILLSLFFIGGGVLCPAQDSLTTDKQTLSVNPGATWDRVEPKLLDSDKQVDSLPTQTQILSAGDSILISQSAESISIVMVGDVMLGTNYPEASYLPAGNNCTPLLEPVKAFIREGDIRFCNLEGVFAGTQGVPKTCKDPKTCYVFRMPDAYLDCITDAGFNVVGVANNHVNDFGPEGRAHESKLLEEAGIPYAGFTQRPYVIFESRGLRIGFCAFSPNSGVMDMRDTQKALEIISFLSDTCDITLVSFHGGAEGADRQHVTRETETFLGGNRGNVYDFAHRAIDAGADVLIGHGPHVTRAVEVYKGRFIAYSLGNFSTYSRFNLSGPNGIAPLINIQVDNRGEFLGGKVVPVHQPGEGGAKPDPQRRAITKLQELMKADFPEADLRLTNEGVFVLPAKD